MDLKSEIEQKFIRNFKINAACLKQQSKYLTEFLYPLCKNIDIKNDTQIIYHAYHNINDNVLCIGGNRTKFISFNKGYTTTCNNRNCICWSNIHKNRAEKIKQTNLEKYGVENVFQVNEIQNKIKQTNLDKYGVENVSNAKSIKDKRKKTNLERYGVDCNLYEKNTQEKIKQKNIENFGAETPFQSEFIQNKIKKTHLEKYGGNPFCSDVIKEKIKQINVEKYGHFSKNHSNILNRYPDIDDIKVWREFISFNEIYNYFNDISLTSKYVYTRKYRPDLSPKNISYPHQIISDFLKENNIEFIENNRSIIKPLELDIYIPEKKLAIEINGIYWHSEISGNKDRNYHLNKLKACEEYGIKLMQFTDVEIINKTELVLSMIVNSLGLNQNKIYARKTKFITVSTKQAREFFETNHIQGFKASNHHFGLSYNNELISCISISKPRYSKGYDYEVIRFANKQEYSIVGSFSKLIKNSGLVGKFISYANRMISNGNLYEQCGWKLENISTPCQWYTKDYQVLEHRVKYQKHKIEKIFPNFNQNISTWQNMINNGYDRYWDCGTKVYSKVIT